MNIAMKHLCVYVCVCVHACSVIREATFVCNYQKQELEAKDLQTREAVNTDYRGSQC